jgi:hypothetical protein
VEIRRLYLPTVESYGRGAWFDLFFRFESKCSRDCPVFLIKLKCFLSIVLYISETISDQQIMSSTSNTGSSSDVSKHIPGFKLTDKERAEKCAKHKLGLCCSCDAGLDHQWDYNHYPHPSGLYSLFMCVACIRYYRETGQLFDFDKFLEGGSTSPSTE